MWILFGEKNRNKITIISAFVDGQDVTALLQQTGIGIEVFGRYNHNSNNHNSNPNHYQIQITNLPKETKAKLKAAGINDYYPNWSVSITHHWRQEFPSREIVKVRHEYDAIPGFSFSDETPKYLAW